MIDYREQTDPAEHRRALKCLMLKSELHLTNKSLFNSVQAAAVFVMPLGRYFLCK